MKKQIGEFQFYILGHNVIGFGIYYEKRGICGYKEYEIGFLIGKYSIGVIW